MAHVLIELARDRQQEMLTSAAVERVGQRALMHGRIARQADRAERLKTRHGDQAVRLRAGLEELESVS